MVVVDILVWVQQKKIAQSTDVPCHSAIKILRIAHNACFDNQDN